MITIEDIQKIIPTTLKFKTYNGHLFDVFVRETMGAYELGGIVDGKFYRSSLYPTVMFSLIEVSDLLKKLKLTKNFINETKKKGVRTC